MPIFNCKINDKVGYKYGQQGKCYTYDENSETSKKNAKQKAILQGLASGSNEKFSGDKIISYLEQNNIGISLKELGLKEADLDDLSNFHQLNDNDIQLIQENFAESRIISLYRYVSNDYGPSNIGDNTRNFCEQLVKRTRASLMRFEDIVALNSSNPGLGKGGSNSYSIFDYRGGVNCKHMWIKYLYQVDTKNLVKSPTQPNQPIGPNGGVPGIKTNK